MTANTGSTILDKIVEHKLTEVAEAKAKVSTSGLEKSALFNRKCYSLKEFMLSPERTGIIAEFKRVSPSKGIINDKVSPEIVTRDYANAGASALSVLTDSKFFGGNVDDLLCAREANTIPILRKEFILDEYQIIEAKSIGADIILLIASILDSKTIAKFARISKDLGLNVLLEVHNQQELEQSLCDDLDAVGVNNRNLGDFSVSLQHSYDLVNQIPDKFLKVSESGISNPKTIYDLKRAGFNGFLIGENFMKEENPGEAMNDFVEQIKLLEQ